MSRVFVFLVAAAMLPGCTALPYRAHQRYRYDLYPLKGTGMPLKSDLEIWNLNGENGWRIVGVINEKYLILERPY